MMRDYLTEKERVSKNSKSFFYKVYNRRIASEIIRRKKHMFFTEKEMNKRNGKEQTVWYFDTTFDFEFPKIVKEVKRKLFKVNKDGIK